MSPLLDIKTATFPIKKTNTLVVHVWAGASPTDHGNEIWQQTGLDWDKLSKSVKFSGNKGQAIDLVSPPNLSCDRLIVIGLGQVNSDDNMKDLPTEWAKKGGSMLARLNAVQADKAAIVLDDPAITPEQIGEFAAGLRLRHYKFDKYKSVKKDKEQNGVPEKLTITLHVRQKSAVDKAIARQMAIVEGTILARDLVNEPANVLGPVEFAKIASSLSSLGLKVEILTEKDMKKLGMGSLLCVSQGSPRPARMAIMQWNGGKKSQKPIAFVGKGVCFDTGGISIKPAGSMEAMKGDMGGAAAVIGLMKTLALRKAPLNVVGVIGMVENMPDGEATRPGDIVTAMSGTTIEIINTDAEGRLVLADALWYTQDRFRPQFMVNLATLTGAIMVALGQEYAGLFSNNDELATRLFDAGLASGEKVWRMPLGPAYDKMIESQFADIKNTGGRYGGSITAAQFLQRFVNDVPWAHLDIAATGFGVSRSEINQSWAPGFGVALLDQLIAEHYEK